MISENELTQYPEFDKCVGRLISDRNLPDMRGLYPVVNRDNWQIEGFVHADDPDAINEYKWAIYDFNDGEINEVGDSDFAEVFLVG